MFIWKRGCAITSFFQSPHLSGQNSPLLSLNNLLKTNRFAVSPTCQSVTDICIVTVQQKDVGLESYSTMATYLSNWTVFCNYVALQL